MERKSDDLSQIINEEPWINLLLELNEENQLVINQVSRNFSHFFKVKN